MKSSTKNLDNFPIALTVKNVAEILGLGTANAYDLCHSKNFPSVITGRRIVVPKPAFIKWLENPNSEMDFENE